MGWYPRRSSTRAEVLLCHQGELQDEPFGTTSAVRFVPLDLRPLQPTLDLRYEFSRLAEGRAFAAVGVSPADDLRHIGFMSWRMPQKRNDGVSWASVSRSVSRLTDGQALAPHLWTVTSVDLVTQAESNFPGMGRLVERLQDVAPPIWSLRTPRPQVAANSFVIPAAAYQRYREFVQQVLKWDEWERDEAPFLFRCPRCGRSSRAGHGRYREGRDIGMFLEHATIYYFGWVESLDFQPIRGTWVGRAKRKIEAVTVSASGRSVESGEVTGVWACDEP